MYNASLVVVVKKESTEILWDNCRKGIMFRLLRIRAKARKVISFFTLFLYSSIKSGCL